MSAANLGCDIRVPWGAFVAGDCTCVFCASETTAALQPDSFSGGGVCVCVLVIVWCDGLRGPASVCVCTLIFNWQDC